MIIQFLSGIRLLIAHFLFWVFYVGFLAPAAANSQVVYKTTVPNFIRDEKGAKTLVKSIPQLTPINPKNDFISKSISENRVEKFNHPDSGLYSEKFTGVLEEIDGPGQPEMKSFQSAGTNNMVDLFTGNLSYNIPLLDVGGYPVNIFYNGNVSAEQDASWVGFGWNINPGSISRDVRGVPDDFKGDELEQVQNMKPNITIGGTLGISSEAFGIWKNVSLQPRFSLNFSLNNYLGPAIGVGLGASFSLTKTVESDKGEATKDTSTILLPRAGLSLDATLSSREGISISPSVSLTAYDNLQKSKLAYGIGASTSYNSRVGIRGIQLKSSITPPGNVEILDRNYDIGRSIPSITSSNISFSKPVYIPTIRMPISYSSTTGRIQLGGSVFTNKMSGFLEGFYQKSEISISDRIQKKPLYGMMYLEEGAGNENAVLDFSRENEKEVTPETPIISAPQYTYDVFTVQGEGTGGSIRVYRNDLGTMSDPKTVSKDKSSSFGVEINPPHYFGGDMNLTKTTSEIGDWKTGNFLANAVKFKGNNGIKQRAFFRNPGETGIVDQQYFDAIGGEKLVRYELGGSERFPTVVPKLRVLDTYARATPAVIKDISQIGNMGARPKRTQVISNLTIGESLLAGLNKVIQFYNYVEPIKYETGQGNILVKKNIIRNGNYVKDWHIGEISVLETSGQRYIYGLPVYNVFQKDYTFSVEGTEEVTMVDKVVFTDNEADVNTSDHLQDNSNSNIDGYTQISTTPAYAHSFLLTGLLSPDYVDITGDGITEDDLGNAVKFNYGHPRADVNGAAVLHYWRTPHSYTPNLADLNKGLLSDNRDNKAMVSIGAREVVYMHSIESKAFIAIFKVSLDRNDGKGFSSNSNELLVGIGSQDKAKVKLEEISLYSKADLKKNGIANSKPIKTVHFEYDYNLCKGTPDSWDGVTSGKLSLRSIWFSYNGMSNRSAKNKYVFSYGSTNAMEVASQDGSTENPNYTIQDVDRWGSYKKASDNLITASNAEFPYSIQDNKLKANRNSGAWMLKRILLPSGGQLEIDYESDTYNYVANKKAAKMYKVSGFGSWNSNINNVTDVGLRLYDALNYRGYDYVIIELENGVKRPLNAYEYLTGLKHIYCKLMVKMPNGKGEWIDLYGEPEDNLNLEQNCGYLDNQTKSKIYIKLKQVQGHSAISFTAVSFLREQLPGQAFNGYDNTQGSNLAGFLRALPLAFSKVAELKDPIKYIKDNMKARIVLPGKGFARLNVVNTVKYGGGHRVREVRLRDNFKAMTGGNNGGQSSAYYGQRYIYEKDQGTDSVFSYGVASYEPGMGNEENPWAEIIDFNRRLPLGPALYGSIENPVLSGLFNAPVVGYSKVIVESVNRMKNNPTNTKPKSSVGKQVTEFHTAQDFPPIFSYSSLDAQSKKVWSAQSFFSFLWKYQYNRKALSQGFLVVLNDMHGKIKTQASYAETDLSTPVTKTTYLYTNTGKNGSNDKLDFVFGTEKGLIKKGNMGIDVDVMTDTRQFVSKSKASDWQVQVVNVVPPLIWIPFPWRVASESENIYRAVTVTKVVNFHGIVNRVVVMDKGSEVSTENLIFDAETGDVIVTRTNNAFKKPIYSVKFPAWWAYSGMGPATRNIDAVFHNVKFENGKIVAGISESDIKNFFENGDELLITNPGIASSIPCNAIGVSSESIRKIWAFDKLRADQNTLGLTTTNPDFLFMDDRGRLYNRENVSIKIIRSGKRNMIGQSVSELTMMAQPWIVQGTETRLSFGGSNRNIINAGAVIYSDRWQVSESVMRKTKLITSTATLDATERITNGNFNVINPTGFTTGNQYINSPNNGTAGSGRYRISPESKNWHPQQKFANRVGMSSQQNSNFLQVDAAESPDGVFWQQNITGLKQGALYSLTFGMGTLARSEHRNSKPGDLRILFNQSIVGTAKATNSETAWGSFNFYYASPRNSLSSLKIQLANNNNGGSGEGEDFGIDGISFKEVLTCGIVTEVEDCIDGDEKTINPFVKGLLGNYRPLSTYTIQTDRMNNSQLAQTNISSDGYITTSGTTEQVFNHFWEYSVNLLVPALPSAYWVETETNRIFNKAGLQTETKNALNIFQSASYGNGNIVPSFVANNAAAHEAVYESFEEATADANLNSIGSVDCSKKALQLPFTNAVVVNSPNNQHTGVMALKVANNQTAIHENIKVGTASVGKFSLSMATKNVEGLINRGVTRIDVIPGTTNPNPFGINNEHLFEQSINGVSNIFIQPQTNLFHIDNIQIDNEETQITYESYVDICEERIYQFKQEGSAYQSTTYMLHFDKPLCPTSQTFQFISSPNLTTIFNHVESNINVFPKKISSRKTSSTTEENVYAVCLKKGRYKLIHTVNISESLNGQELDPQCFNFSPEYINPIFADMLRYYNFSFSPMDFANFKNTSSQVLFTEPEPIKWDAEKFIQGKTFEVGKKYYFSAWVKAQCSNACVSYTNVDAGIRQVGSSVRFATFNPSGPVIEGWQKIEGEFTVPGSATGLQVLLYNNSGGDAYFDDIRIHPFNASMKAYVYDPISLRLKAELNDNNFSTLYEYDAEGVLTRTKVETERGIQTVRETRSTQQKDIKILQ